MYEKYSQLILIVFIRRSDSEPGFFFYYFLKFPSWTALLLVTQRKVTG